MHSLVATSRPRLSEMEPKWFVFETSCDAFDDRIRRFAKIKVNKVKNIYGFNFQVVPLDVHFHYIDNAFVSSQRNTQ